MNVWERHEARQIRGAYRRVWTLAATLGSLVGIGLGLGVGRLLGQGGG
jgi:hypothetical protein